MISTLVYTDWYVCVYFYDSITANNTHIIHVLPMCSFINCEIWLLSGRSISLKCCPSLVHCTACVNTFLVEYETRGVILHFWQKWFLEGQLHEYSSSSLFHVQELLHPIHMNSSSRNIKNMLEIMIVLHCIIFVYMLLERIIIKRFLAWNCLIYLINP